MHDEKAMIAAHQKGQALATEHAKDNALVATDHLNAMARDSYGYRNADERDAFVAGYKRGAEDNAKRTRSQIVREWAEKNGAPVLDIKDLTYDR